MVSDLSNGSESNFSSIDCDQVKTDAIYFVLTAFLILTSIIALTVHIFFSVLLRRSQAFHSNVRFLLQNFSLSACYVSVHSIGRCCYNFILAWTGFQSQSISVIKCEWIETIFNASEGSLTLSMAFIGLERLLDTIRRRHVDTERPTASAYVMVVVCWAAGTGFHFVSIFVSAGEGDNDSVCYCQTMLVTPMSILYYMVAAFFVTELSTAICYIILFRYSLSNFANFTINTAQHSLAERHQMMSNMKTSRLFSPSIILHGTVYAVISLSFVPLRMWIVDGNYLSHICYALLVLIVMELEMMTQAVLLIARKDTLRKSAVTLIPRLGRLFSVDGNENKEAGGGGQVSQRNKIVPVNLANKPGNGKLVDFRIKPEDNDDILNAMWATKGPPAARGSIVSKSGATSKVPSTSRQEK